MSDWKTSSEMGFKFEDFSLSEIQEKILPLAYKNMKKEDYSYYDIVLFNGNFSGSKTVECKFDKRAIETGNICIEVGCNGRLSGLSISKADFWIISDGVTTYIAKLEDIKRCIIQNMDSIRYIKNCNVEQEDGVYKEMDIYLPPKRIFEKYCLEINGINDMTYKCFLW